MGDHWYTLLPCHFMFIFQQDAEKYVNDCYKVNAYKACYGPMIEPINGQNMWQSTGLPFVQPPIKRRPSSRPKKSRVKQPDEPTRHTKLRRVGVPKKCKACLIILFFLFVGVWGWSKWWTSHYWTKSDKCTTYHQWSRIPLCTTQLQCYHFHSK